MKSRVLNLLAVAAVAYPLIASAGDCVMTVTRVACPGREQSCYSKCNGQPTCDETKKVGTKEACENEALRNCTVFRPGETKSKSVLAKFNGELLNSGKNYCEPEKPEYGFGTCAN